MILLGIGNRKYVDFVYEQYVGDGLWLPVEFIQGKSQEKINAFKSDPPYGSAKRDADDKYWLKYVGDGHWVPVNVSHKTSDDSTIPAEKSFIHPQEIAPDAEDYGRVNPYSTSPDFRSFYDEDEEN